MPMHINDNHNHVGHVLDTSIKSLVVIAVLSTMLTIGLFLFTNWFWMNTGT